MSIESMEFDDYEARIIEAYEAKLREKDKLITELCDALEKWADWNTFNPGEINRLIQRAREATR